jgi:hypothetical protein
VLLLKKNPIKLLLNEEIKEQKWTSIGRKYGQFVKMKSSGCMVLVWFLFIVVTTLCFPLKDLITF